MNKLRLPFFIVSIFCLNILIYYRAKLTIEPVELIFAECARNSGRTSAALNLFLLFMLGHFGLKRIYRENFKKNVFQLLITLFAVNHLIHFFFVWQNFNSQVTELNVSHNLHGFITFICLLLLPVAVFSFKKLNKMLYIFVLIHFLNVTYFISDTFYSRYKPVDPAYLHRLGILVMFGAILYVLYRAYAERVIKCKVDNKQ